MAPSPDGPPDPQLDLPEPLPVPADPPSYPVTQTAAPAKWQEKPPEIVRYGPGLPDTPAGGQAELTAERVWRPRSPVGPRRLGRVRRLAGSALTLILLAASCVVLYLRFHHAPFQVTGAAITQHAAAGCTVEVTGRIATNGSAGTVSYQWIFGTGQQTPQPLTQSATAGQHAVYVTVAMQGSGHGRASQLVTLQVLSPAFRAVSVATVVDCP